MKLVLGYNTVNLIKKRIQARGTRKGGRNKKWEMGRDPYCSLSWLYLLCARTTENKRTVAGLNSHLGDALAVIMRLFNTIVVRCLFYSNYTVRTKISI